MKFALLFVLNKIVLILKCEILSLASEHDILYSISIFEAPGKYSGKWCEWYQASPCSASCGYGYQEMVRHCACPVPKWGGSYCIGQNLILRSCYLRHCPSVTGNGELLNIRILLDMGMIV